MPDKYGRVTAQEAFENLSANVAAYNATLSTAAEAMENFRRNVEIAGLDKNDVADAIAAMGRKP